MWFFLPNDLAESDKHVSISEPVITIFHVIDNIPKEHLVCDPAIIEKISQRQLSEHEVYMHLIARRSRDTGLQLKAMKIIQTANFMVSNGWVSRLCSIRLRHGAVILQASERHSMSFNRKKDLCTWVAIHEKASGMAGPCTCIVG